MVFGVSGGKSIIWKIAKCIFRSSSMFQALCVHLKENKGPILKSGPIKVLFVAGQLTAPTEAIPYLQTLVEAKGLSVHITFRPYRDDFEKWLREHYSETLEKIGEEKILRGDIHDAIAQCDVIVGAYSTAVLEGLLQFRVPVFFRTKKWGDYYSLKEYDEEHSFFAEN